MSFESFTSPKVPSPRKFPVATHALLLCATSGFHLCQHHSNSSCMTCLVSGLPVCSSILSPCFSQRAPTANTEAYGFPLPPQIQIRCSCRFQRTNLVFICLPPASSSGDTGWIWQSFLSPPWQYCWLRTTLLVFIPVSCGTAKHSYGNTECSKHPRVVLS